MSESKAQPIGDILDGLGTEATLEPGELAAGAIVLLKVLQEDGCTRLTMAFSDGLGWIERVGMLRIAEALETSDATQSDETPGG